MIRKGAILTATLLALGLLVAAAQEMSEAESVTVQAAEHETVGPYLVDAEGISLYLFLRDEENVSTCYDQCAQNWPPLLIENDAVVGEGVDEELLGSTERDDGTRQVTFNGWPLYYFARDENPDDINGQGVGEVWYLISPEGEAAGQEGEEAAEPADEEVAEEVEGAEADEQRFAELMSEGEAVYMRTASPPCASCHGQEGEGLADAPRLAGNALLGNEGRVIRMILRGTDYMPPFGAQLSDRQVAAVATFVRNSWGNDFGLVAEEEVSEWR